MKTPLKALLTVALALVAVTTIAFASSTQLFSLTNNTPYNLGIVSVNFQKDAPVLVPVPGPGTFSAQVNSTPISITVEGTVVPAGAKMHVALTNGAAVTVDYSNPNGIPIIDPNENF